MKKFTKIFSVVALCAVMVIMSVVPAFAASSEIVEDHFVVDCTHYYKENGNYYFQIKCPKGQLDKVWLSITGDSEGSVVGSVAFKYTSFTGIYAKEHIYSDNNFDYTLFTVKCSEYPDAYISTRGGLGIKIFYYDDNGDKMATNNANGSTTQGRGYWLSA